MPSKKRAGVAAAVRLSSSDDVSLWEQVENQYDSICSDALVESEQACKKVIPDDSRKFDQVESQKDLLDIVRWKFAVGKPRPQNLGLLRSNNDKSVKKSTKESILIAKRMNATTCLDQNTGELSQAGMEAVKAALNEITNNLKGVGPATASAILSHAVPEFFCYMYDEVVDCFETNRTYTLPTYVRVNSACLKIAMKLGESWTPQRVARTLWVAARVLAAEGNDLTVSSPPSEKRTAKLEDEECRPSKRKRRKTKS